MDEEQKEKRKQFLIKVGKGTWEAINRSFRFIRNNVQIFSLGLGFYQVRLVIRQIESIKSNAQEINILIENNHKELSLSFT